MPSRPRPRLDRRTFLRKTGAALGAVWLAGCRRAKPAAGSAQATDAGPTPLPGATAITKGGTVRWAEFYSPLTAEQERAWGINARANREWLAGVAQQFEQENPGWRKAEDDGIAVIAACNQ